MIKNRLNRDKIYSTPQYWNSKADGYQGQAISMWPNHVLNAYYSGEQICAINKYLNSVKGLNLLDAGCGTGRLSRYMASQGAIVQGSDFSDKSIMEARKLSSGNNHEYKVQSLFDLNDRDKFDIIITCASVTVACKNRDEVLNVLQRLQCSLKSNGKILLLEPIHHGFLHRVLDMNLKDFCNIMQEAGLKIEDIAHLHFWPMRLLLAYLNWPRFITVAGYNLGEWIFRRIGYKALGDYVAIIAAADKSFRPNCL